MTPGGRPEFPEFDRHFLESPEEFTVIGSGELGGKALGLARIKRMLEAEWQPVDRIFRLASPASPCWPRTASTASCWRTACGTSPAPTRATTASPTRF